MRAFEIFLEAQRGLPRQGPGGADATRRALGLCAGLPAAPAILDIGCGPGMQSLTLARETGGHVTAVDLHREYLDQLRETARGAGLDRAVTVLRADMAALPFGPGGFDLIWSEGAAYIMGVAAALSAWTPLLKPGGYLAFSELSWTTARPSARAVAFFGDAYPPMRPVADTLGLLAGAGLTPIGHFTLEEAAWWDDYYTPLEAKLPALRAKYEGDAEALGVIAAIQGEIALRRDHGGDYGYEFFIGRKE